MINVARMTGFWDDILVRRGPISEVIAHSGGPVTPVARTLTSKLFSSYHLWEMLYTK